jgi:hypothetical protein
LSALGPGAVTGCPAGGPLVTAACLIDWNLSQAATVALQKSGYYYNLGNVSGGPPYADYTAGAAPALFNETGVNSFCSNTDGAIHKNDQAAQAAPMVAQATCASAAWVQLQ